MLFKRTLDHKGLDKVGRVSVNKTNAGFKLLSHLQQQMAKL